MKTCNKCLTLLPLNLFCSDKYKKDGLSTICRKCKKQYKHENREKILLKKREWNELNKEKINEQRKLNYSLNKERINKMRRECRRKNPEKYKLMMKAFFEKNPHYHKDRHQRLRETLLPKKRVYEKQRLSLDLNYKLKKNLRIRIAKAVTRKNGSHVTDLGCTIEEFKKYLETLFYGEMSWDNYGVYWCLDHIIPLSSFDLMQRDQFLKAAHYTNIQPLTFTHNSQKKDKVLTATEIELLKNNLFHHEN